MPNDPSSPSVPPARGFAGILTLVSDISTDLRAVEVATAAAPPPAPPQPPRPVRFAPPTSAPGASLFSSASDAKPAESSDGIPWGWIIFIGLVLLRIASCTDR
jgi:hypothetical protein